MIFDNSCRGKCLKLCISIANLLWMSLIPDIWWLQCCYIFLFVDFVLENQSYTREKYSLHKLNIYNYFLCGLMCLFRLVVWRSWYSHAGSTENGSRFLIIYLLMQCWLQYCLCKVVISIFYKQCYSRVAEVRAFSSFRHLNIKLNVISTSSFNT